MIEKKKKEKIESKGAYAYDLHEAIRDVRRALANKNYPNVESRLNALYDICAPEIRKAISEEWGEIDARYREQLELYENAEYQVTSISREAGWKKRRDGSAVCRIYVKNPMSHFDEEEIEGNTRASYLFEIWGKIYHERFRACIDCLDRHGELRKWREVDYGEL